MAEVLNILMAVLVLGGLIHQRLVLRGSRNDNAVNNMQMGLVKIGLAAALYFTGGSKIILLPIIILCSLSAAAMIRRVPNLQASFLMAHCLADAVAAFCAAVLLIR